MKWNIESLQIFYEDVPKGNQFTGERRKSSHERGLLMSNQTAMEILSNWPDFYDGSQRQSEEQKAVLAQVVSNMNSRYALF
eukprot:jgi/Picsp_1/5341/NSC_02702-R1_---NA---